MKTETKRQKQVAELIKRHFGNVLFDEGRYIYGNAFVTVTKVKMSPDLGLAKIYVSVFNANDKPTVVLGLNENKRGLKQNLARRIRNHVRRIPGIDFYLDDTLDEMYRLNSLFDQLHDDHQMGEEE